jgi:hypothetical protein
MPVIFPERHYFKKSGGGGYLAKMTVEVTLERSVILPNQNLDRSFATL